MPGSLVLLLGASLAVTDLHTPLPAHHFTTTERVAALADVTAPDEQLFVYGEAALAFDLEGYLRREAPHLLPKLETLSHWAGATSINPQLLLALMEQRSQLLSQPTARAVEQPFGMAVRERGFTSQLAAMARTLSERFYQARELAERRPRGVTRPIAPTALALQTLPGTGHRPLAEVYEQLFGRGSFRSAALPAAAPLPLLAGLFQLPWRQGYRWKVNGAHAHSGSGFPLSSIDVSYDWPRWGSPTYTVAAANSGTVTVFSRCQVRVTHSSGWASNYYHMADISVRSGDYVEANTRLGTYAGTRSQALCEGGSSTGPHLHFSLLYNGVFRSLQGMTLGGYKVNVGSYSYDNHCSRFWLDDLVAGQRRCAWQPLNNHGL
ncbi:M23 family metallopeptidase [Aeromonas schubertii]|uniref:M23 family metallopeptidase n=1 Tax=Aeromonas schubertii TaxID=652 RepID=A0ABS7VD21_9GAMM|nr:M23 family metallopeptidase [Aeromonas schubertii]MBZ6067279.1 M23 family metallopeptidase [Aeromonas schubertii]